MIDKLKKLLSSKKEDDESSGDDKMSQIKEAPKKRETKLVRVVKKINEPYDYQTFIEVFIYSKTTYIHEDFDKYYEGLSQALQQLFDISLQEPEFSKRSLWGLLHQTVYSYLDVKTPMSNYLEAGLLFKQIEESGSEEKIMAQIEAVDEEFNIFKDKHKELTLTLFTELFGKSDKVFSSQHLKDIGFDDSTQPDDSDYYDYW